MKTKIFCDIADYKTIKLFNKKKLVDGFTTNPSLMRLACARNYKQYCLKLLKVCKTKPISFEVFADEPKEMLRQAIIINKWAKNVYGGREIYLKKHGHYPNQPPYISKELVLETIKKLKNERV